MESDISFATVEGGRENREAVLLGKNYRCTANNDGVCRT